jgi:hypothetical protein
MTENVLCHFFLASRCTWSDFLFSIQSCALAVLCVRFLSPVLVMILGGDDAIAKTSLTCRHGQSFASESLWAFRAVPSWGLLL